MNKPKPYKLAILLIIFLTSAVVTAQVQIKCCGVGQVIPHFTKGDGKVITEQLLVEKGILNPITESDSKLELRLLYYQEDHQIITVFKCEDQSINVTRYDSFVSSKNGIPPGVLADYKNIGNFKTDTSKYVFCQIENNLQKKSTISWDKFFSVLIKNHFFDFPSQDYQDKIALKENPKAQLPSDAGVNFYEIKAGSNFRFTMFGENYISAPSSTKYNAYKQNILSLIQPFF
jgi:hypothetical protein